MEMITKRFPIGPISMISPFNFPLNLAAHKIAPAIAAGCPWVMKPASRTPIGAILIAEILSETNLPSNSFSVLPVDRKGADLFTTDERFKLLSFTGSPDVGWELKKNSGKKKVVLELGGNAACIVDKDSDLDYVTERIIFGAFYQSGQSCVSVQRVIAHEEIYEKLKEKLIKKTKTLKKGDPLDIETFIGPLISEGEAKRCELWTNEAIEKGANLLVGGKREGAMFDATILDNVDRSSKVYAEEVFGPIFVMEPFSDFKKAVEIVNLSKFGLQAGIFSSDINKCFYGFKNIECGGVVINDVPSMRVDSQPYGGLKDSGLGREGLRYAIEDMTEIRVMVMKKIGEL
jgi:acyl-CoA reductase-like NAD-dependent aldehyde dehydrogenase